MLTLFVPLQEIAPIFSVILQLIGLVEHEDANIVDAVCVKFYARLMRSLG